MEKSEGRRLRICGRIRQFSWIVNAIPQARKSLYLFGKLVLCMRILIYESWDSQFDMVLHPSLLVRVSIPISPSSYQQHK